MAFAVPHFNSGLWRLLERDSTEQRRRQPAVEAILRAVRIESVAQ
jgi:hypothetical protein